MHACQITRPAAVTGRADEAGAGTADRCAPVCLLPVCDHEYHKRLYHTSMRNSAGRVIPRVCVAPAIIGPLVPRPGHHRGRSMPGVTAHRDHASTTGTARSCDLARHDRTEFPPEHTVFPAPEPASAPPGG